MTDTTQSAADLLAQAKRELNQGNLGMALARALDASDLQSDEAVLLVALMYFTGTGIQRNTETASFYAQKYLDLSSQGKHRSDAKSIIDGTIGTANAKRLIFGDHNSTGATTASAKADAPKWLIPTVVGLALVVAFGAGFLYVNQQEKTLNQPIAAENKTDAQAKTADNAASDVKSTVVETVGPNSYSKTVKTETNTHYEMKSGDASVTVTKDGYRVIKSGDLEIKIPNN
jgi:TPR repeat protein